jgi:hypothetical protein
MNYDVVFLGHYFTGHAVIIAGKYSAGDLPLVDRLKTFPVSGIP